MYTSSSIKIPQNNCEVMSFSKMIRPVISSVKSQLIKPQYHNRTCKKYNL